MKYNEGQKICLIGPGIMPIPPEGWGGVEHLIWNVAQQFRMHGDEVVIINVPNLEDIIREANSQDFDAVHLHYDQFASVMPHIKCKKKMITSHYPYLENPEPQYEFLYDLLKNSGCHVVSLSDRIKDEFVRRGIDGTNVSVLPCGIDTELYAHDGDPIHRDRSIVVGKLEPRKRQAFLQKKGLNIDFIGNNADPSFDTADPCYYGEQSKEDIMENLTSYANMVLLSSGEAHPFVCLEAMASGLGLVLSELSTANLDFTQPFITIIPDHKLDDTKFLKKKIEENRRDSLNIRNWIREYCQTNFDWSIIIQRYKEIINNI